MKLQYAEALPEYPDISRYVWRLFWKVFRGYEPDQVC